MLVKLKDLLSPDASEHVCKKLNIPPETLLEPRGSNEAEAIRHRLPYLEYRICGTDSKLLIDGDHHGAHLILKAYSE